MRVSEKGTFEPNDISEVGIVEGIAGWWRLDGNTKDLSGKRNSLTEHGTLTYEPFMETQSLRYDGATTYLDNNNVSARVSGGDMTFSYYIKFSVSSELHTITFNTNTGGNNILFGIFSGGHTVYTDSEGHNTTRPINDNQWHLVTVVLDSIGQNISQYIDGVFETSFATSRTISSTDRFAIGQGWDSSTPTKFFSGSLADVRLYNRALTQEEIMIQYKLPQPGLFMQLLETGKLYINGRVKEV